jgi:hypothetical protein
MRTAIVMLLILLSGSLISGRAQSSDAPLTSQEIVRLVYQLPKNPGLRDEIIKEIRRRGIGFPLTDGLRGVVATKSGNDALLRRTLEEAERRRLNPTTSTLPPEAETTDLLEKSRAATLAAAEAMPDFVVRELVTRSNALGKTRNWRVLDHLSIAVSYRANQGEDYRLLAVNGQPSTAKFSSDGLLGGSISTGEYVSALRQVFAPEHQASFRATDTDTLRGRRTIVYEYVVRQQFSKMTLSIRRRAVTTGHRGRVWIDRETERVLRLEQVATEIPPDFDITEFNSLIDYDWVTIAERQYLLPVQSDVMATYRAGGQVYQDRHEIRFRNYQKFGSEVKLIEEDEFEEEPEKKP